MSRASNGDTGHLRPRSVALDRPPPSWLVGRSTVAPRAADRTTARGRLHGAAILPLAIVSESLTCDPCLETLATKLQIHPISICSLLEELHIEGVRCNSEGNYSGVRVGMGG